MTLLDSGINDRNVMEDRVGDERRRATALGKRK